MSNAYEDYLGVDSDLKFKDDNNNNFEMGSMDEINFSINKTIASGKKEEENNMSNKFIKSDIKSEKQVISENEEFKLESNKPNNQSIENQVAKNISLEKEKEIKKEKEKEKIFEKINIEEKKTIKEKEKIKEKESKEENPFKKSSHSSSKHSLKNIIVTRPIITRISDLNIDQQKLNESNIQREDILDLEREISELREENEKLNKQGEDDFQKKVDEINNLKAQHNKEIEKIRDKTDKKIKELIEKEELLKAELEKVKKNAEETIINEEKSVKDLNQNKINMYKNKSVSTQKRNIRK